jgi:hypothetical protein
MRSVAATAVAGVLGWLPAQPASARDAADVAVAEARFESTTAAYRKGLMRLLQGDAAAQAVLADVQFVFLRSSVPKIVTLQRFGRRTVTISDGWMSLAEDLARARLVGQNVEAQKCGEAYVRHVTKAYGRTVGETPTHERLETFVRSDNGNACHLVQRKLWSGQPLDGEVERELDGLLNWVLGRETGRLLRGVVTMPAALGSAPEGVQACSELEPELDRWSQDRMFDMAIDTRPQPELVELQRHFEPAPAPAAAAAFAAGPASGPASAAGSASASAPASAEGGSVCSKQRDEEIGRRIAAHQRSPAAYRAEHGYPRKPGSREPGKR